MSLTRIDSFMQDFTNVDVDGSLFWCTPFIEDSPFAGRFLLNNLWWDGATHPLPDLNPTAVAAGGVFYVWNPEVPEEVAPVMHTAAALYWSAPPEGIDLRAFTGLRFEGVVLSGAGSAYTVRVAIRSSAGSHRAYVDATPGPGGVIEAPWEAFIVDTDHSASAEYPWSGTTEQVALYFEPTNFLGAMTPLARAFEVGPAYFMSGSASIWSDYRNTYEESPA